MIDVNECFEEIKVKVDSHVGSESNSFHDIQSALDIIRSDLNRVNNDETIDDIPKAKEAIAQIWSVLEDYRDNKIPEGTPNFDDEWDNICVAMAVIQEDLGCEEDMDFPVDTALKNIEQEAIDAEMLAELDLFAEDGKVAVVQSGRDCDGVAYSGSPTVIDATLEAYKEYIDQVQRNSDGNYRLTLERPSKLAVMHAPSSINDMYAELIIGDRASHYDGIEVHGVRDLLAGVEGDETACEVDYDDPTFYSVYVHLNEGGMDCVGDMNTHALALEYANDLSLKYGFPVLDLSKVGVLAKRAIGQSFIDAALIADEKVHASTVDAKVDMKFSGKVMGVTEHHAVLSLGRSAAIIALSDLDRVPLAGEMVGVVFKGGKGLVSPLALVNDRGLGR